MKGATALSLLMRSNAVGKSIFTCRQCALVRSRLLQAPAYASVSKIQTLEFSASVQHHAASAKGQGLWSKIKFDLGFITGLKYNKSVLNMSAFRMFICCTEMVDYKEFFSEFNMPDTFNSWFLVTDLHVWMCMVRLATFGKDGRVLRNSLAQALWADVDSRSKQLGSAASLTARREGVRQMVDMFHASLFAYDEGLLGDDKELAGAVWRMFFEMDPDVQPAQLETMVLYIRKQIAHIDSQDETSLLGRGFVTFLPLKGDKLDEGANKRKAMTADRLRTKAA